MTEQDSNTGLNLSVGFILVVSGMGKMFGAYIKEKIKLPNNTLCNMIAFTKAKNLIYLYMFVYVYKCIEKV